ncbi:glucan endo-1,3-beta-glucosidase 3 isoform X2 [Cryptomeria japonica]|uniref:glucan endo-1,3-beta-glucosidase 3 isoform X2 n=1 Tax=Cryptomeria japonica TaxID=3369 RepID=UPI0025ACEB4B|nr:glucan endo-1,3-beta-glucosidase 3 isoform X2 [Cryptomeria japonica]
MQGERLVFAERMLDCIRVLLLLLSSFGFSIHGGAGAGAFVGLNVGTSLSNMPSPDQVVSLLKIKKIRHVRLYDSDRGMLLALANTSIEVIISIPNNQVLALGESNSSAANWVNKNVAGYLPDTKITGIVVGNEILTSLPNAAIVLVSAMKFLHSALVAANLDGQETDSYLMMNLYPYYTYMQGNGKVPLDYALFQPLTPEKEAVDPNTLLHYTNVFDAMVDAVYYSMSNLNYTNISVVVAETGWPSKGDASEPRATTDNAATYNSNLVKHIFNITGTPKRPGVPVNTYIYELYNEDLKPGPLSEQNWGLFNANGTPVYALHVSGAGEFLANNITNQSYCVAKPGADTKLLQAALDWACGPGQANCTAIQGGEDCFNPDTVGAHASYAFNSYYHKTGMAMGSCDFKGVATITTTNPSHDSCFYSGSGRGNDSTGNGTTFADSRSTYLIANDSMALYILVLFLSLLLIVDRQI